MTLSLRRTRVQLTAWYVGVFAVVLAVFGAGLFLAVSAEVGRTLDRGLAAAADGAARAVEIRESERGIDAEALVDALDELHVPGHDIYVFDERLVPLRPEVAPAWVADAAREALTDRPLWRRVETEDDRSWRLFARRFSVAGKGYAAVAVADAFEVERQYPALLSAFLAAGLVALALVALGGSLLAAKALVPVEQTLERMRRFMADASHELRTPTTVLRSAAELGLARPRTREEYVGILRTIHDEAEGMGTLVENLLLLAAADEGLLGKDKRRVFLDDVLVEAADRARSRAAEKRVAIRMTAFEEAPVDGDPVLLKQLLLILLDNAVRFTPPGGTVEVSVSRHGNVAAACVADSGPGIPPEHLPHVFERFYRGDPGRDGSGAGIGLSLARAIADAHGAAVRLTPAEGRGTRACVEIPCSARPDVIS